MTSTDQAIQITGPIAGTGANRMPAVLGEQYGYVEEEWFLQGDARSYRPVGEEGEVGAWVVEPDGTAPYKTRVLVRRPADLAAFNGTVVVDWFNVTAGVDGDPDFGLLYPVLLSRGFVYVGVSAQQVAIGGGQSALDIPGVPNLARQPLTESDPGRYGTLVHPGRAFSRADLIEQGLGYDYEGVERTLDSHIRNLRRKIEADPGQPSYIQTIYGIGYRLVGPPAAGVGLLADGAA